jgi:hypothetical protein
MTGFIYSEKATIFCEISTIVMLKSKVEVSQNFVATQSYETTNNSDDFTDFLTTQPLFCIVLKFKFQGNLTSSTWKIGDVFSGQS